MSVEPIDAHTPSVRTVVATYNEADNIGTLIPAILRRIPASSVLVVDDGSPDGTAEVVRTIAARDSRNGYDVVVTLDADFSHDPADIPRLVATLTECHVAIGSRYVGGIRVLNWDVRRLLLSLAANLYLRALMGLRCEDCTSGFRAYRVEALQRVEFQRISSNGRRLPP